MAELDFQKIYDVLQTVLPSEWDSVVFYAEYTEGSYSMKYYVKKNNKYIDCFEIKDIGKGDIIKAFMSIDKIITPVRNAMKKKWNVVTLVISDKGDFKADFDYKDVEGKTISYHDDWEKKYLI